MNRRAFSLLEMLLALALVAMLSGGIFGFLWNLIDRRDALVAATADAQSAGAFFEMLEADIACAVAGDAVLGKGIDGSEHQLRVMSRRVWAPGSTGERGAAAGDLQVSEYRYDSGSGTLRLRRSPVAGGASTSWDDTIGERIAAFRLRYFDGRLWVDSFDTVERGELPVAIEVAIWFGVPSASVTGMPERDRAMVPPEADGEDGPAFSGDEDFLVPRRSPDRLRIIGIADGPTTWWKEAM